MLILPLKSGILINDITDHLPVFMIADLDVTHSITNNYVMKRFFSYSSIDAFKNDLRSIDWYPVLSQVDPNCAYNAFYDTFEYLFDIYFPLKKVQLNDKKCHKPWLTHGLVNACKKKNSLYKLFLKNRTSQSLIRYKNYKNKLTNILRYAEKIYYNNLLMEKEKDIRSTWNILNKILNRNVHVELPQEFSDNNEVIENPINIANGFNNFFVGIGPKLASQIPNHNTVNPNFYINKHLTTSIFLEAITMEEVLKEVSNFKNKQSSGHDGITMNLVKNCINEIIDPLTYVFNLSLETGIFPDNFKIGKVIPIYKSGEKNKFSNYRPISVLPTFSKILEKLFNNRLLNFIDKHNILYPGQFGFRKNMATSHALFHFTEQILNEMEEKKFTIGIFIDLKKAFDTIDHKILLDKLNAYGVRGIAGKWLTSYLSNRKQFVNVHNVCSDLLDISCGIPQGSILGPTLFLLYINDLCNASSILKFTLFADDTNLYFSGLNLHHLCNIVNDELENVNIWFKVNKLTLNPSKTKYIIFSNKNIIEPTNLIINQFQIERVNKIKFLGIFIDEKLNWKSHVTYVQNKVAKIIGIFNKVKFILNTTTLFKLYNALILPFLSYCCEVWGNTYKSTLSHLFVLQKKKLFV